MKKIGLLILFILLVAVSVRAETITETDVGGDTVVGVVRVQLTKTISLDENGDPISSVGAEVGYSTYDSNGDVVRKKTVDLTDGLSQTWLDNIDTLIGKAVTKAKSHANIP